MAVFGNNSRAIDSVAMKAYKRSKPVAAMDVQLAELLLEVDTLRTDLAAAQSAIAQLQNNYTTLLSDYNAHTHSYIDATINDTADGTGTLTETTKTTAAKN